MVMYKSISPKGVLSKKKTTDEESIKTLFRNKSYKALCEQDSFASVNALKPFSLFWFLYVLWLSLYYF